MSRESFSYQDIYKFCENNTLKDIKFDNDGVRFITSKGVIFMDGLTKKIFKSTHCACFNIFASHFTVVSNVMKKCYGYAQGVYIES